jgi:hypothetical protein
MRKDWRETQKKFFVEDVEFEQDQRIINYFKIKDIPTLGYGSISYFSNKIKFVKNLEFYKQALFIFNQKIEKNYLFYFVRKLKNKMINNSKICIAINKFLIYSAHPSLYVNDDYDIALYDFFANEFKKSKIKYFYVKNLKGSHFNFASPTTQFYIDYNI